MNFGDNLKRLRLKNNLSQEQLADKIQVHRSSIAQYEGNNINPSIGTILKIREVLNCSFESLLGEISDKQKEKIEAQSKIKTEIKETALELLCLVEKVD